MVFRHPPLLRKRGDILDPRSGPIAPVGTIRSATQTNVTLLWPLY